MAALAGDGSLRIPLPQRDLSSIFFKVLGRCTKPVS